MKTKKLNKPKTDLKKLRVKLGRVSLDKKLRQQDKKTQKQEIAEEDKKNDTKIENNKNSVFEKSPFSPDFGVSRQEQVEDFVQEPPDVIVPRRRVSDLERTAIEQGVARREEEETITYGARQNNYSSFEQKPSESARETLESDMQRYIRSITTQDAIRRETTFNPADFVGYKTSDAFDPSYRKSEDTGEPIRKFEGSGVEEFINRQEHKIEYTPNVVANIIEHDRQEFEQKYKRTKSI